jgi:hypothetical protein
MSTNNACDCCAVSGNSESFVLETMSVKLTYDITGDYEAKYPFQNSGCGCEAEFPLPNDCEYRIRYRYQSVSTNGSSVEVFDGSDDTYNVGGTFSSKVEDGSETITKDEPTYFTCTCGGSLGKCRITCTGSIYLGERHVSEKTVTESTSVDIEETPCPNENGCVVPSYDPCEGLYEELNPYNCYNFPERCGVVTQGKCVTTHNYLDENEDTKQQTVTQTFSGEVDMWDLPWNTGFEKLEDTTYSGVWDETKDCNFGLSGPLITDFNLYSETTKTLYKFDTINTSLPRPNYIFTCGITPSVSSQFEKHKLRWRFKTPSSCYIKIWVCRYEAKIISSDAPEFPYELSLEDSSIESLVVNVGAIGENSTKCFDGLKACGNHDGWNFTSPEFELTTPEFEFPETDPTLPDQTIGLRKFKGTSLAGISFVEGWEPPLFEYDTEVWKSKCPYLGAISPYWYPTQGLVWPTFPEVLANIQTYFDTVINTIPAP